jgi:transposase
MYHPKMQYTFAGIDSHKLTHTAVLMNCFFEKAGEISFRNAPGEFTEFLEKAEKLKVPGTTLAFGLEDVSAYGRNLTVFLKKNGYLVKHVNSILVAQERKNESISRKTDSVDAGCAARELITKFDKLPEANPEDRVWMLKSLVMRRNFMVRTKTSLKCQLYALIDTHYPGYRQIFANVESKTSLAFLNKYPSPAMLNGEDELADLLYENSNGFWGAAKAQQILGYIERDGNTATEFHGMRDYAGTAAVFQLEDVMKEMAEIEGLLAKALDMFGLQLTSMKGIDTVMACNLIAAVGDIKRFPTSAKLAQYAGVSPVTYASGQKDLRFANHRGNRQLNSVLYDLALLVSMTVGPQKTVINPFFYDLYRKKLSEGKTKRQALKCVQRRLVNILWNMMTTGEPYINPPSYNLTDSES